MDKNLIMVLVVLQLMVTLTSTVHHEVNDLGAAAANFFSGIKTPGKPNVVQMPVPDQVNGDDVGETRNDFVDVDMNEEDGDGEDQFADEHGGAVSDGEDQFIDGHNQFGDYFDDGDFDDDIDEDIDFDDEIDFEEVDLLDMDLEKHIQMHQGNDADPEHNADIQNPPFVQTSHDGDDMDDINKDNVASKMDKPMAPKKKQMAPKKKQMAPKKKQMAPKKKQMYMDPKMKHVDNMPFTKSKHVKIHAQEPSQDSTYEPTSTYNPQVHGNKVRYVPEYNPYLRHEVRYVPVIYLHKRNRYEHSESQHQYNRHPIRYAPVLQAQERDDKY